MEEDGLQQIAGPAVVQEEDSLSNAPQRSAPEHVALGGALRDIVRQPGSHMMNQKIRVEVDRLVLQGFALHRRGSHHPGRVTSEATDPGIARVRAEELLSL